MKKLKKLLPLLMVGLLTSCASDGVVLDKEKANAVFDGIQKNLMQAIQDVNKGTLKISITDYIYEENKTTKDTGDINLSFDLDGGYIRLNVPQANNLDPNHKPFDDALYVVDNLLYYVSEFNKEYSVYTYATNEEAKEEYESRAVNTLGLFYMVAADISKADKIIDNIGNDISEVTNDGSTVKEYQAMSKKEGHLVLKSKEVVKTFNPETLDSDISKIVINDNIITNAYHEVTVKNDEDNFKRITESKVKFSCPKYKLPNLEGYTKVEE